MAERTPRIALVAGSSGAIGGAVALRLAADGHRVYAGFHRHGERAGRVVAAIAAAGGAAVPVELDIEDAGAADAVCERIARECGRLDILVNCAAVTVEEPAIGMDDAAWDRAMRTNLDGAFRLCRAAAKPMLLGRFGRIVNVSSIAAARGGRGQIGYAASKAGLEAMTRVLAL